MPHQFFNCDVAIVGSGPAGASAALVAAKAGLNVLILEKASIPRYKTCGGGILGRAARLLGVDSIPVSERNCCSAEFVLSPELRFVARRSEPIVFMTMRDSFDKWLVEKGVACGARLECDCQVQDVGIDDDCVRLTTSHGEVRARYLIAADGASGQTAKKAGWPDHRRLVPAVECEIAVSQKDMEPFGQSARFDFHCVPQGYGWVFPKNKHLSIGVLTIDPSDVNLNHSLENYIRFLGIQPLSIQRHGFVIPISPRDKIFSRGRVLIVGDAAGFADPVTAEGISNAILSGQLAGHSIAAAFGSPRDVAEQYRSALEDGILRELRYARILARVLYEMPGLRDALFRCRGRQLTEVMTEIVAGTSTYSKLLREPTNYLKLFTCGRILRDR